MAKKTKIEKREDTKKNQDKIMVFCGQTISSKSKICIKPLKDILLSLCFNCIYRK